KLDHHFVLLINNLLSMLLLVLNDLIVLNYQLLTYNNELLKNHRKARLLYQYVLMILSIVFSHKLILTIDNSSSDYFYILALAFVMFYMYHLRFHIWNMFEKLNNFLVKKVFFLNYFCFFL